MAFQATYQGSPWGAAKDWTSARVDLVEAVEAMQPERTLLTFLAEVKQAAPERPLHLADGTHVFGIEVVL